ncbi:hypothetical protein NA56DRAFT_454107 [Hyaloscypha hepaticicola]|uniref:Uncharacterized protein n=1 Tax=Hyaloscypha hepaticicola TaxID=2082293 RepID=A0A2J6PFH1_9HELO|nr:hypothetical protein NA56DRAFT_454107 [Hyaloscypha hepaticicola]
MLCLHMTSNRESHLSSTINISMSIAEAPTLPANGTRRSSSSSPGSRITSLGLKHNTWFLSPKFQISSRKYLKRAPRPINPQTPLFKTSPRGVSAYIPSIASPNFPSFHLPFFLLYRLYRLCSRKSEYLGPPRLTSRTSIQKRTCKRQEVNKRHLFPLQRARDVTFYHPAHPPPSVPCNPSSTSTSTSTSTSDLRLKFTVDK